MGGSCGIRGKAWERRLKEESKYTRSTDLICIVRVLNEDSLRQIEGENRVRRQLCEVSCGGNYAKCRIAQVKEKWILAEGRKWRRK